ncbi:unnamed protein product [Rotaria sp. Silwood2]|nr:unnamed protein product [Rotaria sp. Silwood2]CAF4037695.1 unnamed protein product [Rotaria sp. Silwood2]
MEFIELFKNGQIFRCDVNRQNSLFIDYPNSDNSQQEFDMIYSSFCVERVCSMYEFSDEQFLDLVIY